MKRALLLFFLGSAIGVHANAQDVLQLPPQRPRAATNVAKPSSDRVRNSPKPEVALPAVLKLFDQYQVVGLSDLHGCVELLAFVQQLIRMPEFGAKVNDFTWEPGNARFQGLMDGFILRGKEIPYKELALCWRNNTQSHTYSDTPALFGLLKTIRSNSCAHSNAAAWILTSFRAPPAGLEPFGDEIIGQGFGRMGEQLSRRAPFDEFPVPEKCGAIGGAGGLFGIVGGKDNRGFCF